MLPLLIGGLVLAGGAAWALASGHDDNKPVPASVVAAVAAAVKSGDPTVMRSVAATVRKDGYSAQATSLEDAANELEAAIKSTPAARAGKARTLLRLVDRQGSGGQSGWACASAGAPPGCRRDSQRPRHRAHAFA